MSARPEIPVLLIDGVCSLCEGSVRFLLDRERPDAPPLQFGSLQDEAAKPLLALSGLPDDYLDGVVLVGTERTLTGSDAALALMQRLQAPWPALARGLGLAPRTVREWVYQRVARHRYRLWGTKDACSLPTVAERRRMLA